MGYGAFRVHRLINVEAASDTINSVANTSCRFENLSHTVVVATDRTQSTG